MRESPMVIRLLATTNSLLFTIKTSLLAYSKVSLSPY